MHRRTKLCRTLTGTWGTWVSGFAGILVEMERGRWDRDHIGDLVTEWHSQSHEVSKLNSNTSCVILGKLLTLSASLEDKTPAWQEWRQCSEGLDATGVPMSSTLTAPPGTGPHQDAAATSSVFPPSGRAASQDK